jgi:hypothetical protein
MPKLAIKMDICFVKHTAAFGTDLICELTDMISWGAIAYCNG